MAVHEISRERASEDKGKCRSVFSKSEIIQEKMAFPRITRSETSDYG